MERSDAVVYMHGASCFSVACSYCFAGCLASVLASQRCVQLGWGVVLPSLTRGWRLFQYVTDKSWILMQMSVIWMYLAPFFDGGNTGWGTPRSQEANKDGA